MGRRRRSHLPGCVFHLTARTAGRKHLFTPPLRTAAVEMIARSSKIARVRVLAVAVMSNHLHLVVQQGEPPLAALMQPLLRRLAHAVQRAHGIEGAVFWRPYADRACLDPDYVRNAIVYTHLNPVRAGICDDPATYGWSSHLAYAESTPHPSEEAARGGAVQVLKRLIDPMWALPLFASRADRNLTGLRIDYRTYVDWRIEADHAEDEDRAAPAPPPLVFVPPTQLGCAQPLSPLFHPPVLTGGGEEQGRRRYTPDLSDIARATLTRLEPRLSIDAVKGRCGGARMSELRHRIIEALSDAGFRNCDMARFLGLSESAVSKVVCAARARRNLEDHSMAG